MCFRQLRHLTSCKKLLILTQLYNGFLRYTYQSIEESLGNFLKHFLGTDHIIWGHDPSGKTFLNKNFLFFLLFMFTFEKAAKSLFAAESLKYLSMYKKSQKPTIFIYLLPHKTEKYNTNLIRFCCSQHPCSQQRPILKMT